MDDDPLDLLLERGQLPSVFTCWCQRVKAPFEFYWCRVGFELHTGLGCSDHGDPLFAPWELN